MLNLPISGRSRQYGYIFWSKKSEAQMRDLLGRARNVHVFLDGEPLGEKTVDWTYRRISLGWKQTRKLKKSVTQYYLTFGENGRLKVECR